MNVGSLFSGVGGLDLGLHRAGLHHAFFCESHPWRRSILAHHWPGVQCFSDVRDVGRAGADGPVDLIAGGFPCQDVSVGGQRAGLAGERSGLFFEFVRVAEAIRPNWLLAENVPGLLTSNGGRDFGRVLESLVRIGYGVAWRTLDSRWFSLPQRRRRVFILCAAVAGDDPRAAATRAGEILGVGAGCDRHPISGRTAMQSPTTGPPAGPDQADGTFGQSVAQTLTKQSGHSNHPRTTMVMAANAAVRRLTPVECERLQGWPDNWTNPLGTAKDSPRYEAIGDGVTAPVAEWIGSRLLAANALR